MRVQIEGAVGELTVEQVTTLHWKDSSKPGGVRKFYRGLRVRFLSDHATIEKFWMVINFGAGTESHFGDLNGSIQSEPVTTRFLAERALDRKLDEKQRKGYVKVAVASEHQGGQYGQKLLDVLGATITTAAPTPATPVADPAWQELMLADVRGSITKLSQKTLQHIAAGDMAAAARSRQDLLDLSDGVRSLQDSLSGQMEIVNAKMRVLVGV